MTREEAIKELVEMCDFINDNIEIRRKRYEALNMAIEVLKQPERKKGKWGNCGIIYAGTAGYTVFRCSECGEPTYKATRFCPYCGADMEGEQ